MDGVAGCFERPLHINDGGFLYHCFKLVFFRQQSGNNLQLHPAQKRRMISWVMESTSQRKSGSVSASCVKASTAVLFALPFSAQSSSAAWGRGPRATFTGSRVWSPNTSFNLTLSLGRITISPDKRCLSNNFPFGWNTHLCDFQLFLSRPGPPYPAGAAFRCITVDRHAAGRNRCTQP